MLGCGGPSGGSSAIPAPLPRSSVVWLGPEGLDGEIEGALRQVGVDEVVVRRGSVSLKGERPTLRVAPLPPLTPGIPVGLALSVETGGVAPDPEQAVTLWNALAANQSSLIPVELLLDIAKVPPGMDLFVARLAAEAGVPVLPVLAPAQLQQEETVRLVEAARGCVVLTYGQVGLIRSGVDLSTVPLDQQLEPLAGTGARVRIGFVLNPRTRPRLAGWGDDIDPLTEGQVASFTTAAAFDRVFTVREPLSWSGRAWAPGDQLAIRRMDVARLHQGLREATRLILPELGGWDLIALPPPGGRLGLSRESLIRYLGGEGPVPELDVQASRRGRKLTVSFQSSSPFGSVVSSFGNWVEISCDVGYIVVEGSGGFDQVMLGSRRGDSWESAERASVNSVRFVERYVAPEEGARSGTMTLSNSRAKTTLRWRVVLSNGYVLTGSEPVS